MKSIPLVYRTRPCTTCGIKDLNHQKHEKTCESFEAQIERGERMSDGAVLARMIAEWRATHDDYIGVRSDPATKLDPK